MWGRRYQLGVLIRGGGSWRSQEEPIWAAREEIQDQAGVHAYAIDY